MLCTSLPYSNGGIVLDIEASLLTLMRLVGDVDLENVSERDEGFEELVPVDLGREAGDVDGGLLGVHLDQVHRSGKRGRDGWGRRMEDDENNRGKAPRSRFLLLEGGGQVEVSLAKHRCPLSMYNLGLGF